MFFKRRNSKKDIKTVYPVETYINNAIRYLLNDYEVNKDAISELLFAIKKGGGSLHKDVAEKLDLVRRMNHVC